MTVGLAGAAAAGLRQNVMCTCSPLSFKRGIFLPQIEI
jgi:hypothetical protein